MRYTVTKQVIQVVGELWMGGRAATQKELSAYDMANLEDKGDVRDREVVADWLSRHNGDFQRVIDFRADFTIGDESVIHEWQSDDSELIYNDCMFPEE